MPENSSRGARVLCPTCKRRTFIQDQPWKMVCLNCYLANKGKATPATRSVSASATPIEPDMLKRLIYLAHPDKHANSEAANIATRYLLALKGAHHG
jgi:hypothetical protein